MTAETRVRAWRWSLLGIALASALLVVLVIVSKTVLAWNGAPGWSLQPSGIPFVVEVGDVTANGPAARAGVRDGDRIDLRDLSFADRVFLIAAPPAGRALSVPLQRGGGVRPVAMVPAHAPMRWHNWLGNLILLWIAAFAALIGWRRPEMVDARLLSLVLSFYVAGDALQFLYVPSAPLVVLFSAINTGGVLGGATFATLAVFTALVGRPLSRTRRAVTSLAYMAAALVALYGVVSAIGLATVWYDPVKLYYGTWTVALSDPAPLLVIACGALAVAASRGAERQRVTWAFVSIGSLLAVSVLQDLVNLASPSTETVNAMQRFVNVVSVVAPIGLTYAVLSRRLLDVGFALNRAAVFSVVSIVVVGSFMLIEGALGGWLVTQSHATSTTVSLAIALAIGFSIRFIHSRVDHFVDQLFFRKRHEQEKALLRFAREAAYITDTRTLLERTIDEVRRHSDVQGVAVLLRDTDGVFRALPGAGMRASDLSENEPAIVSLRASAERLDLHTFATAPPGEYAFPLIARGELAGVLVCGTKLDNHPYAPDELDALDALARGVGTAMTALSNDRPGLAEGIAGLEEQFAGLRSEIRVLIETLRDGNAASARDENASAG